MLAIDCLSIVLGFRGTGKSVLTKKLQSFYPRLCIFDTKNEYRDKDLIGAEPECWTLEEFGETLKRVKERDRYKIVFKCGSLDPEEVDAAIQAVNYVGNLCLVLEEAQIWAPKHTLLPGLRRFVTMGRADGLSGIFVTQRAAEIHTTILSQAENYFCGAAFEANDIAYLEKVMGSHAQKLATLKRYFFLHFSPGNGVRILKPVKI